ncbi:AraC family transcriptional regulator [Vallitalea pronyensis]|uniref:AraC family transcriptional regulator n=1 Tax=Vallitalea pronyensis TaxID=1348613 RepID=A0A8J8SIQ4_9FIRM|nr:helix-turn-helix transcriptional regulator [Vallitalea pronyensis]QUI24689.1 AraC family transcriptional regulator [Vallitalea pronyensis]
MHVQKMKSSVLYSQYVSVKIVEQGIVHGDTRWCYKGVTSPFHRLYHVIDGELTVRENGQRYGLKKGNYYLMRRNATMDYYAKDKFILHYLHIQYPLIGGFDMLQSIDSITHFKLLDDQKIRFNRLFRKCNVAGFAAGVSLLYELLGQLIDQNGLYEHALFFSQNHYITLLEKIERETNVGLTVDDMAKMCEQSTSDFSRKFKKTVGMSPKAYLHHIILEKSKVLLASTTLSMKEIAFGLGFNDNLYFSRFFKKYCDMSPMAYRKSQI